MNNKAILAHLTEAADQLQKTIEGLKNDAGYDSETYRVEMSHLYHHLNTAWNGRNCTDEEYRSATNFHEWRKFPDNGDLLL